MTRREIRNKKLIDLPPGWTVDHNSFVGCDFLYKGEIHLQHPCDDNAIRKMVWHMDSTWKAA